jgi:hypothetical protein
MQRKTTSTPNTLSANHLLPLMLLRYLSSWALALSTLARVSSTFSSMRATRLCCSATWGGGRWARGAQRWSTWLLRTMLRSPGCACGPFILLQPAPGGHRGKVHDSALTQLSTMLWHP